MLTPSDKENMSLQKRSRMTDAMLAIISEPACILDNHGTVLSQNERWTADFPSNAQGKQSLEDLLDAHSHASILRFLHAPAQTTLELVEARITSDRQQNVPALIKCVCVENTFILSIRTSEASSHADVNTAEHLFNSLLLDVIPAPVFCKNKDHIYTAVNDDFAKILGLTREELIGRNVYDVAPSRNADTYRQADEELFKNGGRQIYETTIKYFDGSFHDVVFHKSIFYGPDNEPAGLIGIILDITDRKKAEDELKENQELLQAIIDNCPSYIFVKDLEGKYIVAGNKFTQRIGWPNGYLLGKTDYELFPDEIATVLRDNDKKVLEQKKAISEQESFNFDNIEITNLAVKFPLFDANGALKGVAGIATDISALLKAEEKLKNASLELEKQVKKRTRELSEEIKVRKLAEAELTETEAELRNLLSSSPVGVGIYNISDTKFIFSNKALLELFRLTEEEIFQSRPEEFWKTPNKRAVLLKEFQKTGEVLNQEVEFKRKDGSCFIGLLSWKKLYLDGDHRLVVWVNDISKIKEAETILKEANEELERRVQRRTAELEKEINDRKKVEEALRLREAQFEASANSASDWFWGTDENHNFITFSERLEEVTGLKPTELIGSPPWRNDNSRLIDEDWRDHQQTFFEQKPFRDFRYDLKHKDGRVLHLTVSGSPMFDEKGDFKGFRGAGRDITEQIETDKRALKAEQQLQQAQKMEAVGQLTGGIAHDFNNILAIVLGNIDLLQDELSESSPLYAHTRAIERSATRGAQLTQRLLAYSRKQALRPQRVELNSLVAEMLELIDRLLGETIAVDVKTDGNARDVFADHSQIENALMNLCINSSDAMPKGGSLTIETGNIDINQYNSSLYPDLAPGQYSSLSVKDTGMGMPEKVLKHAFEPFFTTKEVGKGTGLGLSMVYGFAKQSNGTVRIDSQTGEGTLVTILLPSHKDG